MLDSVEIWKFAVRRSSMASCFVNLSDRFVFANVAWCRLLGYAEAELLEKTWPEVTKVQDVGADQTEVAKLQSGESTQYYMEKTYIRKDRTEVEVGMVVHRFPEVGPQLGYVVFAKPLEAQAGERELRLEFEGFRERVEKMERAVLPALQSLDQLKLEQQNTRREMLAVLGRSETVVGDVNRNSFNRREDASVNHVGSHNGSSSLAAFVTVGLLILVALLMAVICVGAGAAYVHFQAQQAEQAEAEE